MSTDIASQIFIPRTVSDTFSLDIRSRIDLHYSATSIYGVYYSGDGEIMFKNGNQYKGDLQKGMLHGQGQMIFKEGTIYSGDWKLNKMSGKGKIEWIDQCWYEGDFQDGIRHGFGEFHNPAKGSIYEGEWVHGKRQGHGKLTLRDGSIYEGEFKNGAKSGKGKITYPSGNFYEGQWKAGVKEGLGDMHWVSMKQKVVPVDAVQRAVEERHTARGRHAALARRQRHQQSAAEQV